MKTRYREILQEVDAASTLVEILDIVVRGVKEAVGLDACAVYLIDDEAEQYVLMAATGMGEPSDHQLRLDRRAGLLGQVDERQELVTLIGLAAHAPYPPLTGKHEAPFETFVGMPLVHLQRVLGVLVGLKKAPRELDREPPGAGQPLWSHEARLRMDPSRLRQSVRHSICRVAVFQCRGWRSGGAAGGMA